MKASKYIEILTALINEHGDLEVEKYGMHRITAPPPKLAYRKILQGRESWPLFFSERNGEGCKGEPVFYI